jgi:hypothetical protein
VWIQGKIVWVKLNGAKNEFEAFTYLQGRDLEDITATSLSSVILSARKMDTLCGEFQNVFRTSTLMKDITVPTPLCLHRTVLQILGCTRLQVCFHYRIASLA